MSIDQRSVEYGTRTIDYHLTRSNRRTMEIAVYPDQSVWITAPNDASEDKIEEKIIKRARWIARQQRHFNRFESKKDSFDYVSGETHRYLGRRYLLRVIQVDNEKDESVKLKGKYIRVRSISKEEKSHVQSLLQHWYRRRAEIKFDERFEEMLSYLNKYGIDRHEWQIYDMQKRWGSFTPSGRILLNPDLIKHPTYCIDYVIIHELCHSEHPKHDKRFYQLLEKVLPDWRRRKGKLEQIK